VFVIEACNQLAILGMKKVGIAWNCWTC